MTSKSTPSASIDLADSLIFSNDDDDTALQLVRRGAFQRLQSTIRSLAAFEGDHKIQLILNDNIEDDAFNVSINSLVFQVTGHPDPILIIVPSSDRVDTKKLEAHLEQGDADERISAWLVPASMVEQSCGFPPKSVPPFGHFPRRLRTLVDIQLVQREGVMLLGGGGHPAVCCRIAVETFLMLEGTEIADICHVPDILTPSSIVLQESMESLNHLLPKPFFAISPPYSEVAKRVLMNPGQVNPLKPQSVSIVGRITGVRRMARRLVFCDLAPPNYIGNGTKFDCYDLPWKSGVDGEDMAVQLIAGKTFCKNRGEVDGPELLRTIRQGQLVLVEGKTNVGNRESLGHWVDKRSLDIVLWDYQILEEAPPTMRCPTLTNVEAKPVTMGKSKSRLQLTTTHSQKVTESSTNIQYLTLSDVFNDPKIVVINDLEGISMFSRALESLFSDQRNRCIGPISMVGIDCEWKPSFMMQSLLEPQPVLLMQISLHSLEAVYLVDLQRLLRPCLHASALMNEIEAATSVALSQLLASPQFLKMGFQLLSDLRRLAGSYPHVDAFRTVRAVVEVAEISQKAMQLTKIRNARQVITSLSRLTEYLLDKPLDKEQQISDWSMRPLSHAQAEYAALDAAVSTSLFEKSLKMCDVHWIGDGLILGRWDGDAAFARSISSVRFLFLDHDDGPAAVRKLKAQKVVSEQYIVTQSWVEGNDVPSIPSLPANGDEGPYTDPRGVRRIPSPLVSFGANNFMNLVGQRVGRSKDSCLEALCRGNVDLAEGSKLEFPQRAGYVEFADGLALFVNMPARPGDPSPRGYPNYWLDEGKFMTWFLRNEEWNLGNSAIGQKLQQSGVSSESRNRIMLFVRTGRGDFLCCGRCSVAQSVASEVKLMDSSLVELRIEILDWEELQKCMDFTSMASNVDVMTTETSSFLNADNPSPSQLAAKVMGGNVVGAMSLALKGIPESQRSIEFGLELLTEILSAVDADGTSYNKLALSKLKNLQQQLHR